MKIKYLFVASIVATNLLANSTSPTEMPNVLGFEKILKNGIDKKEAAKELVDLPMLSLPETQAVNVDFNLTGTLAIGNTKYCYLVVESNKIIKATVGMTIKNKKIVEINEYGINVSDGKNNTFVPILTSQIQEKDIVFTNREKVNKNLNLENQEN